MTRESALLVMAAVAVGIIALMVWSWAKRSRRDHGLRAPFGPAPATARLLSSFPGLYVATTTHGSALERLAISGMGFRARMTAVITDEGIALDLAGQDRIFISRDSIVDVAQATVTIDRVVERDGLTRLTWKINESTTVDTYLRPQEASARALAAAIQPLILHLHPSATSSIGDHA